MTTEADIGHGILLQRNDGDSPDDWETIGEVRDISGPSMSKDAPDASHMLSPNRFREFVSGMIDGGEVTFTIAFIPGSPTFSALNAAMRQKDLIDWRIYFPDGVNSSPAAYTYDTAWTFGAHVTNLGPAMPLDESMTADVTLKVSGEPLLESTA